MIDPSEVRQLRRQLKASWSPFFARFGKLTHTQVKCIPRILAGVNVVLCAPTASGKTEAVAAPVAELFVSNRTSSLAILYIVPTRALANDTMARLAGPLKDMSIVTALKHGDKPTFPSRPPNCLITTPESLDSLLCRRPNTFASLQAVILDEIHLLDNTFRGDQLRLLLKRLGKLAAASFATHLLSATLADPSGVAARYVSDFEVIPIPGQRNISYNLVTSHEELFQLARSRAWKKVLFFCNKRETVENTARLIEPLWKPYPVVVHHGSLDRRTREEAETVMKEARNAVCVATSTLEIGIDIGDIDLIVLGEVPWSQSALLQRLGRGNRRTGRIQAAAFAQSEQEKLFLDMMFKLAKEGDLPAQPYTPDLSVAVQQLFSYLFQHRQGVAEQELLELLTVLSRPSQTHRILAHLRENGWLDWRAGYWFASTRVMDLGEKGRIHSNIPDSPQYTVVDANSGRPIGVISGTFDRVFVLGQKAWRVESITGTTIRATRFSGSASAPLFQRQRKVGAFAPFLPPDVQAVVRH